MSKTSGSGDWVKRCDNCGAMCFGANAHEAEKLAKMHCTILQADREVLYELANECLKIGLNYHKPTNGLVPRDLIENTEAAADRIGGNLLGELTKLRLESGNTRPAKKTK